MSGHIVSHVRITARPQLASAMLGRRTFSAVAGSWLAQRMAPRALSQSRSKPRAGQRTQLRWSSHSPMGPAALPGRKRVTIQTLNTLYQKEEPITMLTAHDFPSAHVADSAGIDVVLVGDSLAMVALGMEDTSEVLVEEMLLHCRSVSRGAKTAFTVGLTRGRTAATNCI